MPKFSVIFSVRAAITIEVDVEDKDHAYDRAKDALYDVLNGGNVGYEIHEFELIDNSPVGLDDLEAAHNEQECREALIEAGWRRATPAEIAAGFQPFQHRQTGSRTASTWAELAEQLLAES